MDTLVHRYSGGFDYNQRSMPTQLDLDGGGFSDSPTSSNPNSEASPTSGASSDGYSPEEGDCSDACLRYINQMLMEEEDLENKPCMFHDCSALQAAEKLLYDLIHENPDDDDFSRTRGGEQGQSESYFEQSNDLQSFASLNGFRSGVVDGHSVAFDGSYVMTQPISRLGFDENSVNYDLEEEKTLKSEEVDAEEKLRDRTSPNGSRGKRNHYQEDGDSEGGRGNKQIAVIYAEEEPVETKLYDDVLLCPAVNAHLHGECEADACNFHELLPNEMLQGNGQSKSSAIGRQRGRKKSSQTKEMVDLRTLLTQCAQAVSSSDTRTANDLLNRIRQHSSPHGDGNERAAHYFANAFEARLAGTGMPLYTSFASRRISTAEILKAYQLFVSACPFWKMSYFYANRTIINIAETATRLHIIDFGILYGFQWPCLIHRLSMRTGGPPKLRITGIEFPQPGFRPAERVEETGRCLANYCKRFNVPFEYNAVAKKWHTIQLEDLKIKENEVLVVNSLYRFKNVPDDTVSANSPRDSVLDLIRMINPDIFIQGAVNGTFNAPFFLTRFREALFHFSALFDMFEATVPREEQLRLLYEKEVYGRDVMNVIACEGTERVERPETYKQWRVRNTRAGFRQLPLNEELVGNVRKTVKLGYHKDFVVDEDKNWMLQGWKGRIIYGLSCWKPVPEL